MTDKPKKVCETCKYFTTAGVRDKRYGLCRFNPPLVTNDEASGFRWPSVRPGEWCGSYRAYALTPKAKK
jgi:hypothetical protein